MVRTYDQLESDIADQPQAVEEYQVKRCGRDWCSMGAIAGLSSGLIACLAGSVLTILSWFTATEGSSSALRTLGTTLLFVTIPLLILGAHCLDLRDSSAPRHNPRR